MAAFTGKRMIAAPFERDVQPRKLVAMIEPGQITRAGMLQDQTRLQMLS